MTEPLIQDQRSLVSSIEANLRWSIRRCSQRTTHRSSASSRTLPNDRHPHGNHRLSGSWLSFLLPSFISRAARISDILVSAKERVSIHSLPTVYLNLDDRCVIDEISLAIIQAQSELSSLSTPSVSPLDERSDRIITLRTTITSLENQAREAFWTMNERRVELFEKELEVSGKGRTGVEPLIIVGDFRGVGVWQEMADGIDR
ncbi:hypothetical protein BC829DRAFT_385407 [Chytridium lagenaria]|nr:hypothetical protein BC829DRAFT_385407 [Chytridium lagenaria]